MQQDIIFKETVSALPGSMQSTHYIKNNGRTVIVDGQTVIRQDEELPIVLESGANIEMLVEENNHIVINGKVPTNLSDLNDDEMHRTVTDEEKAEWDAKSDFNGSWNDLTDKPFGEKWIIGEKVDGGGVVKFKAIGYIDDRKRYLHENSVIEAVIDDTVIICPLEGVSLSGNYTVIGYYNDFEIQIGDFKISTSTNLYAPKVIVPDNAKSVTYKYPESIKQLDEKYIPDTIARVEDIPEGGTGGSTTAIIDVDTLPTAGINANAFYRVKVAGGGYSLIFNGVKDSVALAEDMLIPAKVYGVDTLPEVGEPFMVEDAATGLPSKVTLYYLTSESNVYLYMPAEMADGTAMWATAETLNFPWELISSPEEATNPEMFYILQCDAYTFYTYNGGEWVEFGAGGEADIDLSEYAKKSDIPVVPTVPTKVSQLSNDAGYVKEQDLEYNGSEGLKYTLNDSYATLSGIGQCTDTDIVIGDTVCGLPVTSLGVAPFMNNTDLTSVTILDGVKSIGNFAFMGCSNLTSVTIPDSVVEFNDGVFKNCPLLYTEYEKGIYVGDTDNPYKLLYGLTDTSQSTYLIHEKTEIIGYRVFESLNATALDSIIIPNGVKTINKEAFYTNKLQGDLILPSSLRFIGESAFENACISTLVISDGLTAIGDKAFYSSWYLASVTIPKSITSIGVGAFGGSTNKLTDVYYTGTEEEWAAITIGAGNEALTNATIHYNSEV